MDTPSVQPPIEDVYFDGIAYESLSNLQSPYNPKHWELMAQKLDGVNYIRRKVTQYKLIEASFILLLLFLANQYLLPPTPAPLAVAPAPTEFAPTQPSNTKEQGTIRPSDTNALESNSTTTSTPNQDVFIL